MPTDRSLALANRLFVHLNNDDADQEAREMAADLLLELSPEKPEKVILLDALKAWRRDEAKAQGRPAFYVFSDRVLDEIVRVRPAAHEVTRVKGIGPAKAALYGEAIVGIVKAHARA